jgi:long-chain fatty acid transport protein
MIRPPRTALCAACITAACIIGASTVAGVSLASTGIDSPEAGSAHIGRGGAWLARADDPLASYFNPAALVRNPNGVHLGAQLLVRSYCFERRDAAGEAVSPGQGLAPPPGEVCADMPPFPNPQLAVSYRVHPRLALGLALVAPHAAGLYEWPETIVYAGQFGKTEHPSPQRYLLMKNNALVVFPTLSAGFSIHPSFSVGAGFVWGIASLEFSSMTEATSSKRSTTGVQPDDFSSDIKATVSGFDGFVPGFVVSTLWSATDRFDIAAWYRWSDAIKTRIDLYAQSGYYTQGGAVDASVEGDPARTTDESDAGRFRLDIPMQAKLGLRYHHPRSGLGVHARGQAWLSKHHGAARDSLSQDLFDIELDITWANNSAVDDIEVRFDSNIPIVGTPGFAPENADFPHRWRDVIGVRLGGEFVPIPDLLAVRAGGFFETKGVDDAYLNVDFHLGHRIGLGGGVTLRLAAFDLNLAYQHTSFGELDNGGQGAVLGISGDLTSDNRTLQTVNGGRVTSSLDEIALGATYHF